MTFIDLWNYVEDEKVEIDLVFTQNPNIHRYLTPSKAELADNAFRKCKSIRFPNAHGDISWFENSSNFWELREDAIDVIEENDSGILVTGKTFHASIRLVN